MIERKVSTHTTGQLYHWASPVNIDFVIAKSLLQDIEFFCQANFSDECKLSHQSLEKPLSPL